MLITASLTGTAYSSSSEIIVAPSMPVAIVLTPPAQLINVGASTTLQAYGQYSAGMPPALSLASLPFTLTWSLAPKNDKIATIDAGTGKVTAVGPGTISVVATAPSVSAVPAASARLTIVAAATVSAPAPVIYSNLVGGSTTLLIGAGAGHFIRAYQFTGMHPTQACDKDPSPRTELFFQTSSSTTEASVQTSTTDASPYLLTLSQPLITNSSICVTESTSALDTAPTYSLLSPTKDADDYGRVRTYFVGGVQISNQLASGSSSTAGPYFETGLNYTLLLAKDGCEYLLGPNSALAGHCYARRGWHPGFSTNADVRLSPIPVAAPTTTVTSVPTASGGSATQTATASASLLSSQQSVRVVGSTYFPVKLTHWDNRSSYFTVGPLVRGGFGTLLNPSTAQAVSLQTIASTTATVNTSANYASAYSFAGFGFRLAWEEFKHNEDKSPQVLSQLLVTMGGYSNLPSYVCKGPAGAAATFTTTSCSGATPVDSRTLVPRLDLEGFVRLPDYPFIVGIDANLAQYTAFHRENIDYLNKPGNDIRIFFGLVYDLPTLLAKLGVKLP